MKALVTRPAADAADLAASLGARGIESIIEPLLEIRFIPEAGANLAPMLADAQAVLFTSANGVRAFAAATSNRDLPVFAVGDATAAAARSAGFRDVESAGGNVEDLARLVIAVLKPGEGALLHAAGSITAGDLGSRLAAAGFELRRIVLYEAAPATRLGPATEAGLRNGEVDVALFFSPRTATVFVTLASAAGLAPACRDVTAIGLSPAVAAALSGLAWRELVTAAGPTEIELLAALDRVKERPKEKDNKPAMSEPPKAPQTAVPPPPRQTALPPLPPPLPRGRRSLAVPLLVLLLVAVLGVVGSAPYWSPRIVALLPWGPPQQADTGEDTAALEARLAAAEQRIAALTQQAPAPTEAPSPPPSEAPPQNAQDRLAALALLSQMQGELRRLGQAQQQLADRIDQSNARIDAIAKQSISGGDSATRVLMVALGELRGALETSRPFYAELATVAALAHDRPEIATALGPLETASHSGLPSQAMLASQFADHDAAEILRADLASPPANEGLGQRILAKLRSLVVIRRVDAGADGDPVEMAVADAQAMLDKGDLAGAVKALDGLTGPAGAAARVWLAPAHQRLAAEQVLAKLSEAVAADLATGAEPAKSGG